MVDFPAFTSTNQRKNGDFFPGAWKDRHLLLSSKTHLIYVAARTEMRQMPRWSECFHEFPTIFFQPLSKQTTTEMLKKKTQNANTSCFWCTWKTYKVLFSFLCQFLQVFFSVANCSFLKISFSSSFKDLSHGLPRAKCTTLASQPAAALTSMAYHPLEARMYTAALDGLVRCYDLQDEVRSGEAFRFLKNHSRLFWRCKRC